MPPAYDPAAIEAAWYARWEEARLFVADAQSAKPKFSIAIPPPNVTGELHMGHAANFTLQDVWCRYRRMTGYEVLWLPGTDHAAIATQNVLEKQLAAEGTSKEEIGRAAFEELVDEWYRKTRGTILEQTKELGASVDFTRTRFTMDPQYVHAVREAFVRYYEKGWMYRGPRIVNWCPRCLSAISDLEVDWQVHHDTLYRIAYPIEGTDEKVVIATVRPETMLADTGVAVHPEDPRYAGIVGKHALLPLVGRRLPIVADAAVERGFGTGALKVTPGHDAMDYEIGERHHLELINGMHPDGRMNTPFARAYDGKPALEARELVVRDLEAGGYLVGTEPYTHEVGHCDRCGTVLEPLVSEQWFLKMDELAGMCIAASERREVRWHPERFERTYLDWLRGIRDWCVSRQLWLGHRIPVWYCPHGHRFADAGYPEACRECGAAGLTEDPDVLDTWFSSALWPFATLGWPQDNEDLRAFYPTSLNSTARDIINLWVTRMIFSGLFFMGSAPFSDVIIHATIQAPDGRRMSKSLGTGVDPREVIARRGADALRAWASLVGMSSQDVRFDESRIEGFKRFTNKLWNATRLVLGSLGAEAVATPAPGAELELEDRWILSRLQATVEEVTAGIEGFALQRSVTAIYDFAWHEFCDWYLEAIKARLRDGEPAARAVAVHVLDVVIRLLHPFMPFVTEELWSRLPGKRDFVVRNPWPAAEAGFRDPEAEARLRPVLDSVQELRAIRKAASALRERAQVTLESDWGAPERSLFERLGHLDLVAGVTGAAARPATFGRVMFPTGRAQAAGGGRLAGLREELAKIEARLADPAFVEKAPAAVVDKNRARLAEVRADIERLAPAP
ncbi:MAG TPA: valine--tRNA ligase [Candidatus Dormibacteraeota bacterium]